MKSNLLKGIIFSSLIFLFVNFNIAAQSIQSDSLYAIGVSLYEQQKYNEAIPYFEKCNNLDQAELDSINPRRLSSLTWLASCYYKIGDEESAIKHDKYTYKFKPIDRRLTIVADSLEKDAIIEIKEGRNLLALNKFQTLDKIENDLYDEHHYTHINTYRILATCHINLKQFDEAAKYIDKARKLIVYNYGKTDTLQITDVINLIEYYSGKAQFDNANKLKEDLKRIISTNFNEDHVAYAHLDYITFNLLLMQRKWYEVEQFLPTYIESIKLRYANEPEKIKFSLLNIRTMLYNCGQHELCTYIDGIIEDLTKNESYTDLFGLLVLKWSSQIASKNYDEAETTTQNIEKIINQIPNENQKETSAILLCLRCFNSVVNKRWDESKDLFLQIEKDSISRVLDDYITLRPIYLTVKMTMCLMLDDYEGALYAVDKQIELINPSQYNQNLNLFATQASINAMAGNYKKAREITKETISRWKKDIIDQRALYRLEKDTTDINNVLLGFDSYIKYTDNLPDSAEYTMREIKGEYLLLKADILKNLDSYNLDYSYYECISDYALELIKIKKYIEAQEVMDTWLAEWKKAYDSIDKNEDNESLRLFSLIILDEALEFRCNNCYEKGDPAGIKAYEDLFSYLKYEYGDNLNNAKQYRIAMMNYFDFIDDNKGLLKFFTSYINLNEADLSIYELKTIASTFENVKEFETATEFYKKIIHKIIAKSSADKYEYILFPVIDNISKIYSRDLRDTIGLLNFYEFELLPSLITCTTNREKYFIKSIDALRFNIKDDIFIPMINRILEKESNLSKTPQFYAILYNTIAGVLFYGRNCKELTIDYLNKAQNFVKDDPVLNILFGCYLHKAMYEYEDKYYDECIAFGNNLLELMNTNEDYKATIEYLCLILRQLKLLNEHNNYEEIINLGESYLNYRSKHPEEIPKYIFNIDHSDYANINYINHTSLSDHYFNEDDYIRKYLFKALCVINPDLAADYALDIISDQYNSLETSMDYNNIYEWGCDNLISASTKYAARFQTDSLKIKAFEASLFCKGLQLRSTNSIHAIIKKSGHKGALRKFNELQTVIKRIPSAHNKQLDSLLARRNELETDLLRLSEYFGDYKKSLHLSWKNVQSKLGQKDIAIEFTYADRDYYDSSKLDYKYGYYACIIKPDKKVPEIVYISESDSITSDLTIYTSKKVSNLIFSRLDPYLNGVENIYYSPIGELNRISLESLPLLEDTLKTISSKYNFYRVSSTAEIYGNNLNIEGRDAVVYGGLKYNSTVADMTTDAKKYEKADRSVSSGYNSYIDVEDIRGALRGIPNLPGTKFEAESIAQTINSMSDSLLQAQTFIGKIGTEASFKALDGKQKRIIHIATHGFYIDKNNLKNKNLPGDSNNSNLRQEDKSLMRSGLLFAGAINRYHGVEIPERVEDGILTSNEIANINLSGLDLCVLSACETAQGDISSEGVYGLQRGFKKAGAKSILMSLWKVDDEATSFLMNEFYKHWILEKQPKYKALELAKESVRIQKQKGWENPKYWAAFILLDGLN